MKPGYKSTEFYGMLAAVIVGALVLLKILEPGEHQDLTQAITNVFTGAAVTIANAAVVVQYIRSRTELKHQEAAQLEAFADRERGNA